MKWGVFIGWCHSGIAEALAGTGVVEPNIAVQEADPFEQVERAYTDTLERFDRLIKGQPDRTLARQIIYLVRLNIGQNLEHTTKVIDRHGC